MIQETLQKKKKGKIQLLNTGEILTPKTIISFAKKNAKFGV